MAKLGWIGSVALAAGASAGAAAAQFGLGYGLGVIAWSPSATTGPETPDSVWLSSLSWTLWIAATSTIVGAICADRRSGGELGAAPPRAGDTGVEQSAFATAVWRLLLAVAAAVGALLSVALVLVPARAAVRLDTDTPQLIAAGYAVVGITVGIIVSVYALVVRAGAINVIATAIWIWALAIAAVVEGVIVGRGLGTAPLDVWPNGNENSSSWTLPVILLVVGVAFVIGIGSAWLAARRGSGPFSVGAAGAAGPVIVVVAYLLTQPRMVGVDARVSAYILVLYALIAGIGGSAFLSAIWSARMNHRSRPVTSQRITSSPKKAPIAPLAPAVDPYAEKPARGRSRGKAAVPAQTPLGEETTRPLPVSAEGGVPARSDGGKAESESTTALTTSAPKPQSTKRRS
jgi:hypothetical protein